MNDPTRVEAVRTVVVQILHRLDSRRWADVRALYADEVVVDYTSLFGGDVTTQRGDDLIAGWRKLLTPIVTQHFLGPIDVAIRGDVATAECHVRGYHLADRAPGGREWMVAGHYVIELQGREQAWKVTKMTLQTFYQTGNRDLLSQAAGSS